MGGPSTLGMASLLIRLYRFGVVGFCTLGVDWQGSPHFSIGYTGWCSRLLYTWAQLAGEGLCDVLRLCKLGAW